MLSQTSESAIQLLLWLAMNKVDRPAPPHAIAAKIGASPSYLAKITRMLVKANILRSWRGAQGGVKLARDPKDIPLLEVVEACQGLLIGNYCQEIEDHIRPTCAFHEAMAEVNKVTRQVLARWSIGDLAARPAPSVPNSTCRLACVTACSKEKEVAQTA